MTSPSKQPYYLQETTETSEEIILPAAEDDINVPNDETPKARKEREEEEKKAGVRRVKVGNVELDPKIDFADFSSSGPGLDSRAKLDENGMINIWVDLKKPLPDLPKDYARPVKEYAVDSKGSGKCPPLNIVIFITGSRGDVQPYLSMALSMIKSHSHRVRIATHPDFKDIVSDANQRLVGKKGKNGESLEGKLDFFDVGGDPKELMAYMVKNPGLLPGFASLTNGDIPSKREMTKVLLEGFYKSTHSPNAETGEAFAADAIISNPPAFAHVHVAEALGLPLLLTFTMPWCPTIAFNHPLVNIKSSNAEQGLTNYLSYALADMLQWQGLGDVINAFRTSSLGLEPLSLTSGPSVTDRVKVPWTFCWSESLIPKPKDWREHIDISGFYFLENDGEYEPESELASFLDKGEPPIYIGFGSVVVEDADAMTATIFNAVKKAGVRALVSAGWGDIGGAGSSEDIFIIKGNVPHDWLFADGRVSAVCHHGGAGTTAIGLRNGIPTIVVPFFGDQEFWGNMIHRAGAGPAPIPQRTLTEDNLAQAIKEAISQSAKAAAQNMGAKIRQESGEEKGVASFHRHLPLLNMRCDVDPSRVALWWSPDLCLKLSGAVAALLVASKKIDITKLEPHRPKEYDTRRHVSDPLTGGGAAIFSTITNYYAGIAQIFYNPPKGIINTATAIPKGLMNIVMSVHEGMANIPQLMGSSSREAGKVDDFSSGVKEGGKGLFFGYWDGITGLVKEPIEGAKKEGAMGALKGIGRSYVNATVRPAIGILGVMALPLQGAWQGIKSKYTLPQEEVLRKPRETISRMEADKLSPEDRTRILADFEVLEKATAQRQSTLRKKAKRMLEGEEGALEPDSLDSDPAEADETDGGEAGLKMLQTKVKETRKDEKDIAERGEEAGKGLASEEMIKDIDRETELKQAERKGYEKALAELRLEAERQKSNEAV
ncbi:hypothetical protein P7C73_g2470, partial [Tremellales sp. Uapishka_1]